MNCSASTSCSNPKISKWEDEFFCFNCFETFIKNENITPEQVNIYQCCENPNIHFGIIHDVCINCGTIHEKITNELPYMEGDEYQTNVLHKSKKIHIPYKYLMKKYPEIKYQVIYDFIINAINYIQETYKFTKKPFTKYVPYLYNFYRNNVEGIPDMPHFENKKIKSTQDIINYLYELLNIETDNNYQIPDNQELLNKYYYFNKSKNRYFKKKRFC